MRTAEISFIGQSRATTAKVKIVGEGDIDVEGNNQALREAKRLYDESMMYALNKTMQQSK